MATKDRPLTPKQVDAAHYLVFSDLTINEVADIVEVNVATIYRWKNDVRFQNEMRKNMYKRFGDMAVKAAARLNKLIDCKQDAVAFAACKEVLNKAGFKETDKIEQSTTQTIKVDVADNE